MSCALFCHLLQLWNPTRALTALLHCCLFRLVGLQCLQRFLLAADQAFYRFSTERIELIDSACRESEQKIESRFDML